jgi:hypothetical protein
LRTLRTLLPYMSALLAIAAIYAGWTIFSRWNEPREADRAAKQAEAQADKTVVDRLGGGKLKILQFWAEPGAVRHGERALVCYGVANAKSVRIEPHIEDVGPALSRCLEVFPKHTTEYKLTAVDAQGHSATGSIVLRVE